MSEADPSGRAPNTPGAKLDAAKPSVARGLLWYFPNACKEIARVSVAGARKYTWSGWETVPDGYNRYSDAAARHLLDAPQVIDADTGAYHLAQVAWNAMAALELYIREQQQGGPCHRSTATMTGATAAKKNSPSCASAPADPPATNSFSSPGSLTTGPLAPPAEGGSASSLLTLLD